MSELFYSLSVEALAAVVVTPLPTYLALKLCFWLYDVTGRIKAAHGLQDFAKAFGEHVMYTLCINYARHSYDPFLVWEYQHHFYGTEKRVRM
ncbi:hypothetical protein MARILYN_38 [Vibrio phage Marilyn]|nr:hypothetical protein MARILYN_38 [Vibrio phage Marilyn]WCD55561.1 hypothetical protein FAYDEN_38 [Vibrio phage Fayden]WCD55618.1 hypothetical protein BAYBAE_38 [Vibrio phage Baybae]WCD55677.1 hypothetical protein VAITEPHAGE_38 [Vibrio phage Vaitephage]